MHFHLPKPLHGWREFAGEVAIIVLGVTIALGAEQAVEAWHWHHEVDQFRAAVDHEIGYDLSTYEYRLKQAPCVVRRLDELSAWSAFNRVGGGAKLKGPIATPMRLSPRTSAWEWRTGDVANHISLDDRLAYSEFYDAFSEFKTEEQLDYELWRDIGVFQTKIKLQDDDRTKLAALVTQARLLEQVIEANWPLVRRVADRLQIKAMPDPNDPPPPPDFCRPIFSAGRLRA